MRNYNIAGGCRFVFFPAKTPPLVSCEHSLFLALYTKPNRKWCFHVFYEHNTYLRSWKTVRRTLVPLVRPLTVFIDLKRVLFLRQHGTPSIIW